MKAVLIISLVMLICLTGVMAYIPSCGDDYCNTDSLYQENNPTINTYCPMDCGILTNEDWCHEEYNLINIDDYSHCPACPTCGGCGSCTIGSISPTDLNNWCTSTGYSKNQVMAVTGTSEESSGNSYVYSLFLVIGFGIGYIYQKNKKGKRR
jgi:hypothetical protein